MVERVRETRGSSILPADVNFYLEDHLLIEQAHCRSNPTPIGGQGPSLTGVRECFIKTIDIINFP